MAFSSVVSVVSSGSSSDSVAEEVPLSEVGWLGEEESDCEVDGYWTEVLPEESVREGAEKEKLEKKSGAK